MQSFAEETLDIGHGPSVTRPTIIFRKFPKPVEYLDFQQGVALEIGKAVPEVEAIFIQQDSVKAYVWIIVHEEDDAVFHKVYAKERELMELFDAVDFKFRILQSQGMPPRAVMTDQNPKLVYVR